MEQTTRDQMPLHYESIFKNNPEGIFILEHLHFKFYDPPTVLPLNALELAFRAGQRDVVRHITLMRDQNGRNKLKDTDG